MVEEGKTSITPEILTLVDKERFRRQVVIATKLIAVGLILAIIWFGWVNYVYAKNISDTLNKYGSMGYCYMCGKETLKKCECQYNYNVYGGEVNFTALREETAIYNMNECNNKDLAPTTLPWTNVSSISNKNYSL